MGGQYRLRIRLTEFTTIAPPGITGEGLFLYQIEMYQPIITDAIGGTPLLRIGRLASHLPDGVTVLAKAEYKNPGGSVKDRMAIYVLKQAVASGELKLGGTIVEATSGNTGAAVAMFAAANGYQAILTIPDKMSQEKMDAMRAFGAKVVICPTAVPPEAPESYYEVARRIVQETPNAILANQYFKPENPAAHYRTTGPEIWAQTGGEIDCFVTGMGTGVDQAMHDVVQDGVLFRA